MKTFVFSIATMAAALLSGCGSNNDGVPEDFKETNLPKNEAALSADHGHQAPSVDDIVAAYLEVKNALTNDDGRAAAVAGKRMGNAVLQLDEASFSADQRKVYDEVKEDMQEHAEHIGANAEKIAHQREHFDVLSKDVYDLVKVVKPTQTLYKAHCPMFNDKKGAIWISEAKAIRNPYYGKRMLGCGEQQEEIQ